MIARAALAAGLLSAAMPPGVVPGAGLLVVPGLAAFFAMVTARDARRPLWWAWVAGGIHVMLIAWSLRHTIPFVQVPIGMVGGLYWMLAVVWMRALSPWAGRAAAFGVAVAATCWLRAVAPEIPYPHGQPVHALYHWPWLLGPTTWGGEPLGNFLLATLGAAVVELWRAWREAVPRWHRAAPVAAGAAAAWILACVLPAPRAAGGEGAAVRVLAIQPNFAPAFQVDEDYQRRLEERLVRPTLRWAGPGAPHPPDLVLWPESSWPGYVALEGGEPRLAGRGFVRLAERTRLLAGAMVVEAGVPRVGAVLVDRAGRLVEYYEKLRVVPAGERLPFGSLLPETWREALLRAVEQRMGGTPRIEPGRPRPLPRTAAGVPFGVMVCFDNAFPDVAARQVAAGARFLTVLSNESWYRGGSELDQMEAMTVLRALETRTPIVRCTTDGISLMVDGDGRVVRRMGSATHERADFLAVEVVAGPGRLPPLAWIADVVLVLELLGGLPLAWAALRFWARLLRAGPRRVSP